MNGQSHPECDLSDSSNYQTDDTGNIPERYSVYPRMALSGIDSVAEEQKRYQPDRHGHPREEATNGPGKQDEPAGSLAPTACNMREYPEATNFDPYT